MNKVPLTTDEKIDLILKYQARMHHWAVFRGIMSFLFFIVFVILPIIGGFFFADYIKNNVNLNQMKSQFDQFGSSWADMSKKIQQFGGK